MAGRGTDPRRAPCWRRGRGATERRHQPWWVLDDDHGARRREVTLRTSTGSATAVFSDELYDVLPQTRGSYGRLHDFGVRLGYEGAVLHLRPQVQGGRLESDTARTAVLHDPAPPWGRWGEQFAAATPDDIVELQGRAALADCPPRQRAIRDRVRAVLPRYRLSHYRATRLAAPPRAKTATGSASDAATGAQVKRGASKASTANAAPASCDPETNSSRGPMETGTSVGYRQARRELTINCDFGAATDLIGHWRRRNQGVPGVRHVIGAQVHEWCKQGLIKAVLTARNSTRREEQLRSLLSPTSFTAALLPRHLLHAALEERLARELGAPANAIGAITVRRSPFNGVGGRNGHEADS